MNKTVIWFFVIAFETAGSFAPILFGDNNFMDVSSILGGFVGGIAGVIVGVAVARRFF